MLGKAWRQAIPSKQQWSVGACVDGIGTTCTGRSSAIDARSEWMSGFKQPDFLKRQEASAIAKKAELEKFRAKAADPALADRLTERTARAADSRQSRMPARRKRPKKNPVRPNERSKRNVGPRCKPSSLRLKSHSGNASWKLRRKVGEGRPLCCPQIAL